MVSFSKRLLYSISLSFLVLLLLSSAAGTIFAEEYVPGEIVLKLTNNSGQADLNSISNRFGLALEDSIPQLNVYLLRVPADRAVSEISTALNNDNNVEYANPNYFVEFENIPNDPYWLTSGSWGQLYDDLWGLKKIEADKAWDQTTGSADVAVAVLDSGIDFTHEDLQGRKWTNPGETGNGKESNGVDDDNNGYVDDWQGWDFGDNDNNPNDFDGHGTAVAGVIGAAGNNGLGISGVNWNMKLASIKLGSNTHVNSPHSAIFSGIKALVYAADMGFTVSNASWVAPPVKLLEDATAYAHSKGLAVIAAAGNANQNVATYYPAGTPYAIAVSATDYLDNKGSFSNWGPEVDVAAPGVGVIYLEAAGTSGFLGLSVSPGYGVSSGTSLSAPFVSGLAALILSKKPNLTNEQLRQVITESADDLGAVGKDNYFGYGRINAFKALNHSLLQ